MKYKNLEMMMKKNGISRRFLAEKLGITYEAVSHKVNGYTDFKITEMKILSRFFGVSMDFLFESED